MHVLTYPSPLSLHTMLPSSSTSPYIQAAQISSLVKQLAIERPVCSGSRDRDLGVTSADGTPPPMKPPRAPVLPHMLLPGGADAPSPLSPLWRHPRAREVAGGRAGASSARPPAPSPLRFPLSPDLSPLTTRATIPTPTPIATPTTLDPTLRRRWL